MASNTRIYSGPGQLTFYDATNNYFRAGYADKINLVAESEKVELLDRSLRTLYKVYRFEAELLNSDQEFLDALETRTDTEQTIYVVGFESLLTIDNLSIVYDIEREYGRPHKVIIRGQTTVDADVQLNTNLLGADAKFEVDTNTDGLADGWSQVGLTDKTIETSFLSGGGNCQHIEGVDEGDYLYKDVVCPMVDQRPFKITLSAYVKENGGLLPVSVRLYIELIDDADSVFQSTYQAANLDSDEEDRLTYTTTITPTDLVAQIRAKIAGVASTADLLIDNAQLELGGLSDFTEA